MLIETAPKLHAEIPVNLIASSTWFGSGIIKYNLETIQPFFANVSLIEWCVMRRRFICSLIFSHLILFLGGKTFFVHHHLPWVFRLCCTYQGSVAPWGTMQNNTDHPIISNAKKKTFYCLKKNRIWFEWTTKAIAQAQHSYPRAQEVSYYITFQMCGFLLLCLKASLGLLHGPWGREILFEREDVGSISVTSSRVIFSLWWEAESWHLS